MTYTTQTDLPPLSAQESTLFSAYTAVGFDPLELLKDPAFTSAEVFAFLVSPAVQARLALLTDAILKGLVLRAAKARQVAADALERIIQNTAEKSPELYRAALALLRASTAPLIPPPRTTPPEPRQPRQARVPSPPIPNPLTNPATPPTTQTSHQPDEFIEVPIAPGSRSASSPVDALLVPPVPPWVNLPIQPPAPILANNST